jgi:hypothetical protein
MQDSNGANRIILLRKGWRSQAAERGTHDDCPAQP